MAIVSVKQYAERMDVTPGLIYSLIRKGELVAYKLGRTYRLDEVEADKALKDYSAKEKALTLEARKSNGIRCAADYLAALKLLRKKKGVSHG